MGADDFSIREECKSLLDIFKTHTSRGYGFEFFLNVVSDRDELSLIIDLDVY